MRLAKETNFRDKLTLHKIYLDLKVGANIGCKDPFRAPGRASNAPSAYEEGEKVADSICDWVKKGFAYGPVKMQDVPPEAKFNGIMTRPKPNGAVRIILNLSAPKGSSVNDGICSQDFPAVMSSTTKWLRALNSVGVGALMTKIDWSDAYKHVPVARADTELQWFSFAGRAFKELCLIFGGSSSAGIFDRLAKLVLSIVIKRSGINPRQVCQHLDDACAAGSPNSNLIFKFDNQFSEVAKILGIQLAPCSDRDKSFAPATEGTILGVHYDTARWNWAKA